MSTATFAVQPSSWVKFDERGCDWATDINNAYDIARIWKEQHGEDCTIWRVLLRWTTYGMGEQQKLSDGQLTNLHTVWFWTLKPCIV